MNDLNRIASLNEKALKISAKRRQLQKEAEHIRGEARGLKKEAIYSLAKEFAKDMQNEYTKTMYIRGKYTGPFTRHVNRQIGITPDHQRAVWDYMEALQYLNSVFADIASSDPEEFANRIASTSGLKNMHDLI